jgi:tRNA (mo5U34)-methyltransferase
MTMLHTLLPLKPYRSAITLSPLATEIRAAWSLMRRSPHWAPLAQEVSSLIKRLHRPCEVDLSGDTLSLNLPASIAPRGLESLLRNLSPWRIGPYRVGSTIIDSEWRSFEKWRRIAPLIGDLSGARVADVGCNNGYFLFKLATLNPELLVGFDPIERCWLQCALLQGLAQIPSLAFIPTGIATVEAFPAFFDLVLCMGVIYHQRDPFTACKKLFSATKPGGRVILESLVIPQSGSYFLVPNDRYAKMRNAWIIPTPEALATLLERAGFHDSEIHTFGPVTTAEQRRTEWAPYESLADFLDPMDLTKTVEGHPAPHSSLVIARKR